MIRICPKCCEICVFLLPDFDFETGKIIENSKGCIRCKSVQIRLKLKTSADSSSAS